MNVIKQLIEDGRLEEAKSEILELEVKLGREKSKYSAALLMKQIEELKAFYRSKLRIMVPDIQNENRRLIVETPPCCRENHLKAHLKEVKNENIDEVNCVEGKIENCEKIIIQKIRCDGSLMIINVNDSEITCEAQQIRLINCENVTLNAFSKTGIFLQDSTGILIKKSMNPADNQQNDVYDFTSPSDNKNYRII